nr:NAD-dependent epimerase/dehydratase family protein [Mangrovicoccus algicola]
MVLGASGRVGRLLRGAWPAADLPPALFQSRSPGAGIGLTGPIGPGLLAALPGPPAAVLVLSGVTGGDEAALAENTRLALAGLDLGAAAAAPVVLLCSTAAVYAPGSADRPFRETDGMLPPGAYGRAKRAMEAAAADWAAAHPGGPAVLCLRLANVAGADMLGEAVRRARPEAPLRLDRLPGGGAPRRSYLSPMTLARAVCAIAAAPPRDGFGVVNLAEPGGETAMDALLAALAQQGHPVPWSWRDAAPGALASHALDLSRQADLWPGLATTGAGAAGLAADWLRAGGGCP